MENQIYCNWDDFVWIWDFKEKCWLIDLEESGGPPSIHEESPTKPPYVVVDHKLYKVGQKNTITIDLTRNEVHEWDTVDNCDVAVYTQGSNLHINGLTLVLTDKQLAEVRSFFENT